MEFFILIVFILGYLAISIEHTLKVDKLVPALLMMSLAWAAIAFNLDGISTWFFPDSTAIDTNFGALSHESKLIGLENTLLHHFGKTCEILIFLMGAMTIVEMIDYFDGFESIKRLIKTRSKRLILWIVCGLAFFLSAIIDNLTATIVLITLLRKIIHDSTDRMYFSGFVIIAANAGGAWTPIGDVTTTMLWMNSKVTTLKLSEYLILPSLVNILIPLGIASFMSVFKGEITVEENENKSIKNSSLILISGLVLIVFVPVFKTISHLPPYIGMMLSLSLFAIIAEIVSKRTISFTDPNGSPHSGPTMSSLSKIEMPSILFFLGILMTVAAMESLGMIFQFGQTVNSNISETSFVTFLGLGSAIVDNVPLVAASMGMFTQPTDATVWHFIAYAAGTGGSILIIGSAAGVVAMGMERISFMWYLKHISILALIGYFAGIGTFLLLV